MTHARRLVLPLLVLAAFGFGCFTVGPRIVRVPDQPALPGVEEQVAVSTSTPANEQIAVLAYAHVGSAHASVSRNGSTEALQDDVALTSGDRVTVTDGTVTLIYPGAGQSQLETGSDVVLLSEASSTVATNLELVAGSVWTRFEKVFGPSDTFSVTANNVVATVRGTGFGVMINGDTVDVQVAEHAVTVSPRDDVSGSIFISEGRGLLVHAADVTSTKDFGQTLTPLLRTLGQEKNAGGYVFASTKIDAGLLQPPLKPIFLRTLPADQKSTKANILMLRASIIDDRLRRAGFAPAVRGVLPNEIAPKR